MGYGVAGLGTKALATLNFATLLFMIAAELGTGIGTGPNSLITRYIRINDKKM